MKSTPYETRFYYLTGHPANPMKDRTGAVADAQPKIAGQRKVGQFVFTDGAMQLTLPAHKSQRNAKFLERSYGISSEVIKRVDVPTRSRSYSPKSEAEGVLGLVDANAGAPEGQPSQGSGPSRSSAPDAASLEAIRGGGGVSRPKRGSSVASPTTLDPAQRAALLGNGPGADKLKSDSADGLT